MSYFTEEALQKFNEMCAEGVNFGEEPVYDFARCVRPDGSAYGTAGACKSGKQQDKDMAQLRDQKPHKPPAGWKPYGGGPDDKPGVKIPLEGVMQGGWLKQAFEKKMGREMNAKEIAKAEKMIGVLIPKGQSAEDVLQRMLPKGAKVHPVREA
jgi:hypothetical protein